MFDNAFASTQLVFEQGSRATSAAARYIVHEIGHAIDMQPLRTATLAKDVADQAAAGLPAKFPDPQNPGRWKWTNREEEKEVHATLKAQQDAEANLLKAKSRSGTTVAKDTQTGDLVDVIGTSAAGSKYREAATKDGIPVSTYAAQDWQENYAEAYSLYVTAPDQLKRLRPSTFAYLDKTLPEAAQP